MLYVTGDIHGNAVERFSYKNYPYLRDMNKEDFAIILGDFGIPFGIYSPYHHEYVEEEKYNLDFLESKRATILALAGNHDDRNFTKQLPQIKKFGGKVREMYFMDKKYPTIYYIDEPTILTLGNKKCLFVPGAKSHDIEDGIINPWTTDVQYAVKMMKRNDKIFYRIADWDWWEDEDINKEKVEELIKKEQKFDYIFSHTCPLELLKLEFIPSLDYESSDTEKYLQNLAEKLIYNHWYHGHFHINFSYYNDNITCLYKNFEILEN